MPAIPKEHTERQSTLDTILCLVKNNPNDQDLGRKVRKFIAKMEYETSHKILEVIDNMTSKLKRQKKSLERGQKAIRKAIKKTKKNK